MARISNWTKNPRGLEFAELCAFVRATSSGGFQQGKVITFLHRSGPQLTLDEKRMEIHLSKDEIELLQALLNK